MYWHVKLDYNCIHYKLYNTIIWIRKSTLNDNIYNNVKNMKLNFF